MINKNIKIALVIFVSIILVVSCWFIFDFSPKIDVLKHPEKYSFRMNFASFFMQNDYYFNVKYPNSTKTFFQDLKSIEAKYRNSTDDTGCRIRELNNKAFDLYHDLLSLNSDTKLINKDDYVFLAKNCEPLMRFYFTMQLTYPKKESNSELFAELAMRKEAIEIIKEDLKNRKINAVISLDDVKYENLIPAYINYNNQPEYIKQFEKIYREITKSLSKSLEQDIEKADSAKSKEELATALLQAADNYRNGYWEKIDNLNINWKHRYLVSAIEYKNNKEDKIIHLFEIYPYKEGNRIYWNVQYYSPNSEFIKAYLKMLELLVNF